MPRPPGREGSRRRGFLQLRRCIRTAAKLPQLAGGSAHLLKYGCAVVKSSKAPEKSEQPESGAEPAAAENPGKPEKAGRSAKSGKLSGRFWKLLGASADQHRFGPYPPLVAKQKEMMEQLKAGAAAERAAAGKSAR